MLAIVPKSLRMMKWNNAVGTKIQAIPGFTVILIDAEKITDGFDGHPKIFLRNDVADRNVAVVRKKGMISVGQDRHIQPVPLRVESTDETKRGRKLRFIFWPDTIDSES
jgi:hypothetical protein